MDIKNVRTFTVYRRGDLSETHDANQVNPPDQPQYEGAVFSDGTVAVRWLTLARSTSVWADFDTLWRVHGHADANSKHGTVIVWGDDERTRLREQRDTLLAACEGALLMMTNVDGGDAFTEVETDAGCFVELAPLRAAIKKARGEM